MPEHIPGTNMWNLLQGEYFIDVNGKRVEGPIAGVRIEEFEDLGLLKVQGNEESYEVKGTNFAEVVKKKP